MDAVLARLLGIAPDRLAAWMKPGRYVSGHELAQAGLAELIELAPREIMPRSSVPVKRKPKK
jgi:hypothetical protein